MIGDAEILRCFALTPVGPLIDGSGFVGSSAGASSSQPVRIAAIRAL
jgi:hypothetical protein